MVEEHDMTESALSGAALVTGLMVVGAWLESVGNIRDHADQFFTAFPLGAFGLAVVMLNWVALA
jgi:hypothetical protein